jgi:hypothetical protein
MQKAITRSQVNNTVIKKIAEQKTASQVICCVLDNNLNQQICQSHRSVQTIVQ